MSGTEVRRVERPGTVDDLVSVLADAARSHQTISIAGGSTRANVGNVGPSTDIELHLDAMNKVIEYSPDDLVISVEAGCTISQLRGVLAGNNQFLPIDAAHPAESTIGGAFASGTGGPSRHLYGSLKDFVIGVEAVTVDGVRVKSGGNVVKNVSGYDMGRLYSGSLGAFGIVTRLNLKVYPRPEACQESVFVTADAASAYHFVGRIIESGVPFGALYLRWNDGRWHAHIWNYGASAAVTALSERVAGRVETTDIVGRTIDRSVDDQSSFVEAIDFRSQSAIARVARPLSRQLDACGTLIEAGCTTVVADPSGGLVYGIARPSLDWREEIVHRFERPVFLSLPAEMKQGTDVFGGLDEPVATIVRRLKDEFDPERRLNPGRYVLNL